MIKKNERTFITFFPNCKYRYLDLAQKIESPISSPVERKDLNEKGYDAFFTPNGFAGDNATIENCTNLNAFYIDIDKNLTDDEISEIRAIHEPTFIIKTKNGFHFYWCLDESIYKDETEDWAGAVKRWEKIEQAIVDRIKIADRAVKDIPRILRVPDSYYWKNAGDAVKNGTAGVFKIKGIHKDISKVYSMNEMEEAFPSVTSEITFESASAPGSDRAKRISEAERKDFFERVNRVYPIEERDSFQKLISADPSSIPGPGMRNQALLVTATLMRQAGWTRDQAIKHINKVGWHGIENERGGPQEIVNTINSAFNGGYTYSFKNEIISHNMSDIESQKIQQAFTGVLKERREQDKVRFSNYERELLAQNPYLKKNEIGIVFRYVNGVYKMMSDQEVSDMVLNGLYEDMLWGYRTKKNVSDKVACLLSIIPLLEITNDRGYLVNVKNGILNIVTRKLIPHTPNFVSLIQYPVVYDPNATCPVWDNCVSEWMSGPEQAEKIRLIKQFCGYCLSSDMYYDRALFMVGDGGNGKSTFIDTIAKVIGPDATSHIDLEALYSPFGMHGLIGKRLNIIEEVHGNYYQSNKLKKVISGEKVTIDIKYKPQFTFRPQAKFVFAVNMLPRVDDTSNASERRICAVTFLNNYRKNPNFKLRSSLGELHKELSGILNWMLDGARDLAEMGNFIVTKEQTRMLDEYREENSSVEGFLSQCVVLDPDSEIEVPKLYSEYKKWSSTDGGRKIKANITFTKEVKAYGEKDSRFTYAPRLYGGTEAKFVGIKMSPHWVKNSDDWTGYN